MKKVFTLFLAVIISLSVFMPVFADMGGPEYEPIAAVVTAYESADIYNYGENTDDLNVAGSIEEGEKIEVIELGDEYCYASNNNNFFWIKTKDIYLESKTYVVNAKGGLNFRSWPSTDSDLVMKKPIDSGATIIVISFDYSGDWAYIRYLGKYGWVSSAYIVDAATTTTATTETSTEIVAAATTEATANTAAETTAEATANKTTAVEDNSKGVERPDDTSNPSKVANATVKATDKLAYIKGMLNSNVDMFGLKVKCLWLFAAGAGLILLLLIIVIVLLSVRLKKSKKAAGQVPQFDHPLYQSELNAQPTYRNAAQAAPDINRNAPAQYNNNGQAHYADMDYSQETTTLDNDAKKNNDISSTEFGDKNVSTHYQEQGNRDKELEDKTQDSFPPEGKNE